MDNAITAYVLVPAALSTLKARIQTVYADRSTTVGPAMSLADARRAIKALRAGH